ncbi:hypothetical protein GCM10007320_53960 [Pseudorhodoferax aquiterrae]|uniref:Membrane-associated sensor domain-containing protein n=1 Tax=Pseudorhodoferax aquiterrae TaxID=747304 RepID=A0ABQ3GA87_9BURK|nr:MASE4 domain-containing protein [Pseudorhodoferax aquiterrae]GHC98356.1 hypothetical protein GCM10007320_53960 [Pseudorhodoferax aquiterrae]
MQVQDVVDEIASAKQQRKVFFSAALVLISTAAVLPFAAVPLRPLPHVSGIYAAATAMINLATFWLLTSAPRQPLSHAVIAAAYLFSGLMAVLHLLTFPGALIPDQPVMGSEHAVSALFIVWRAGFAVFIVWAALCEVGSDRGIARQARFPTVVALAAALFGAIGSQFTDVAATDDHSGQQFFGLFSLYGSYVAALLAAGAVALILLRGLHQRAIFVWLIVVLAAEAAGVWLSTFGGARYTLAWYAVRVEGIIASAWCCSFLHSTSGWCSVAWQMPSTTCNAGPRSCKRPSIDASVQKPSWLKPKSCVWWANSALASRTI